MAQKFKDKEALRDWDAHKRSIEQATPVDNSEDVVEKRARIARLLSKGHEIEFLKYYFPHYCKSDFAEFQEMFIDYLVTNDMAFVVAKWSRAHAKSVVLILVVLYLKFKGKIHNFLLASHNETNAVELITPLRLEFEKNQRLINDFGVQVNPGNWTAEKFVTLDGFCGRALGAGQSPRGARDEEARPDMIATDDIDTEEVCRNPKRLDELWEWVIGALYGCFDIKGSKRFVVAGNKIGKDCVVERAIKECDYHQQVDILVKDKVKKEVVKQAEKDLADHKNKTDNKYKVLVEVVRYARLGYRPSWYQRFSLFECVYMITKMGYRMSQREYFNNPLVEGKVFKKEWMQFKELPPLKTYRYLLAYLDPGFKKTATSDSKCQILVGLHNGEFHIRKVFCGKASVEEMIEWGYEMDRFIKRNNATYRFKMEEVFLQSLLYKDYQAASAKKGYPLPVSGDTRKKPDKDARIEAISGYFERGVVFFDEEIREEHHVQAIIEQLLNFEPGVKTLKDGPDALEGAMHLLQQHIRLNADIDVQSYAHNKHRI